MRRSIAVAVLALLGNATAFSLSPGSAAGQSLRSSTETSSRRHVFTGDLLSRPHAVPTAIYPQHSTVRGGSLMRNASEQPAAAAGSAASPRPPLDVDAVMKYIGGTAAEFGIIMGLLTLLQKGVLQNVDSTLGRAMVFLTFGFLAMKSRTFAVLNARRPDVDKEEKAKAERRLPSWMPPPKVFPIIWISIGFLRAISSTLVWEAVGYNLVTAPIAAMVLHLCVGDTWNHINNVERKLGVAVSGVFLVWVSVANAVYQYYEVLPKAGLVLLPSLIWISVANLLVQGTWRLNGKQPLYPPKETA